MSLAPVLGLEITDNEKKSSVEGQGEGLRWEVSVVAPLLAPSQPAETMQLKCAKLRGLQMFVVNTHKMDS